jgi:pimeloyl-ACP methyl ester carboxylesterase
VSATAHWASACRKATGPAFQQLDTASAARDLDAVRTALGERKLNLYGHSYDTLLGQQYAALFGAHAALRTTSRPPRSQRRW